MKVLDGKAGVLSIRIDDTFYPVLCATRVRFQFDHEEILTTSRNSGLFRERESRLCDMAVQLDGLSKIDDTDGQLSFFYNLQTGVRGAKVFARLRYTDAAGTTQDISGYVLVKQGSLDGVAGGFSNASLYLPFSGAVSTGEVTGVADIGLFKLYLNTTEGAFEVSDADLEDATEIMLVMREDGQYKEVSGTPSGRQFKYTNGTGSGKLSFDSSLPFNAGEIVYVEFKKAI